MGFADRIANLGAGEPREKRKFQNQGEVTKNIPLIYSEGDPARVSLLWQ